VGFFDFYALRHRPPHRARPKVLPTQSEAMIFLVCYVFAVAVAVGLGILAAVSDYRGMTIPNFMPLAVLAAFAVAWFASYAGTGGAPFSTFGVHMIAGAVMFVLTFILFALRVFGGGDAKLLSAYAFWFTPGQLILFLAYVTLLGAVIAVAALVLKKKALFKNPAPGSWIARTQSGEGLVPYGIAIAVGAGLMFAGLDYMAPELFALFLVPAA